MDINILTHGGKPFKVNMNTNDVLRDLKKKICKYYGLDVKEQKLIYMYTTMNDDDIKLTQYGLCDGCDVKLIINFKKESFKFFIEMQGRVGFDIDVFYKDTLRVVQSKIQDHCQLTPEEQILVYQGKILEGDNEISYFGLQEKSVIYVLQKLINVMKIYAQTMDGKIITFEVIKSDRVFNIKMKIQENTGLSIEDQKLVYQGVTLEDDKTVEEYQMAEKSVIKVMARLKYGMVIFAKSINSKMILLEVTRSDTVNDIKTKIQEKMGLSPAEQKLVYRGEMLEDERTLEEYQICEKSVVDVVARSINRIHVVAKTMDGNTVEIEVSKSSTVLDIKTKIQEKIGLSREDQKLVYQGGILEDVKTLDECHIADKSIINVVAKLRNGMQIYAKTMDEKRVTMEITKSDRVIEIKMKIQEKIGLNPNEQILVYQGVMLKDDKTADEYQIAESSVINVVARLRGSIQIFAKTMDEKMLTFYVMKSDRVIDIKMKIQEKIGLCPNEQILVYQGGILEDYKTVDEYHIAERSVINVGTPLRSVIDVRPPLRPKSFLDRLLSIFTKK